MDAGLKTWIGKNVVVLSPTSHYWMGKLVGVDSTHLYLEESAWIADVGRHHKVFGSGKPDEHTEFEPHLGRAQMALPITSVVIEWPHELWRVAK